MDGNSNSVHLVINKNYAVLSNQKYLDNEAEPEEGQIIEDVDFEDISSDEDPIVFTEADEDSMRKRIKELEMRNAELEKIAAISVINNYDLGNNQILPKSDCHQNVDIIDLSDYDEYKSYAKNDGLKSAFASYDSKYTTYNKYYNKYKTGLSNNSLRQNTTKIYHKGRKHRKRIHSPEIKMCVNSKSSKLTKNKRKRKKSPSPELDYSNLKQKLTKHHNRSKRSKRKRRLKIHNLSSDSESAKSDVFALNREELRKAVKRSGENSQKGNLQHIISVNKKNEAVSMMVDDECIENENNNEVAKITSEIDKENDMNVVSVADANVVSVHATDESDSLEEQTLRLIALKSAIVKKHLERKKRKEIDSKRPYSPSDFEKWCKSTKIEYYKNDFDEINEIDSSNVSPLESPLNLINEDENDLVQDSNTKPIDIEIANSDSDSQVPIFIDTPNYFQLDFTSIDKLKQYAPPPPQIKIQSSLSFISNNKDLKRNSPLDDEDNTKLVIQRRDYSSDDPSEEEELALRALLLSKMNSPKNSGLVRKKTILTDNSQNTTIKLKNDMIPNKNKRLGDDKNEAICQSPLKIKENLSIDSGNKTELLLKEAVKRLKVTNINIKDCNSNEKNTIGYRRNSTSYEPVQEEIISNSSDDFLQKSREKFSKFIQELHEEESHNLKKHDVHSLSNQSDFEENSSYNEYDIVQQVDNSIQADSCIETLQKILEINFNKENSAVELEEKIDSIEDEKMITSDLNSNEFRENLHSEESNSVDYSGRTSQLKDMENLINSIIQNSITNEKQSEAACDIDSEIQTKEVENIVNEQTLQILNNNTEIKGVSSAIKETVAGERCEIMFDKKNDKKAKETEISENQNITYNVINNNTEQPTTFENALQNIENNEPESEISSNIIIAKLPEEAKNILDEPNSVVIFKNSIECGTTSDMKTNSSLEIKRKIESLEKLSESIVQTTLISAKAKASLDVKKTNPIKTLSNLSINKVKNRKIVKINKIINQPVSTSTLKRLNNLSSTSHQIIEQHDVSKATSAKPNFIARISPIPLLDSSIRPSKINRTFGKVIINVGASSSSGTDDNSDNNLEENIEYDDNASPLSFQMDDSPCYSPRMNNALCTSDNQKSDESDQIKLQEKEQISNNKNKIDEGLSLSKVVINDVFQEKLENFLKNARSQVENEKEKSRDLVEAPSKITSLAQSTGLTPVAVRHLPESSQLEYRMLINRMKMLERQKNLKKSDTNIDTALNKKIIDEDNISEISDSKKNDTDFQETIQKSSSTKINSFKEKNSLTNLQIDFYKKCEIAYEKNSNLIVENLNRALKFVEMGKDVKFKKLLLEKKMAKLKAELNACECDLKLENEKISKIYPAISKAYDTIVSLKNRRSKLNKASKNVGKALNGTLFKLNENYNSEINNKFKHLSTEISNLKNLKLEDVEKIETKKRKNIRKADIQNKINSEKLKENDCNEEEIVNKLPVQLESCATNQILQDPSEEKIILKNDTEKNILDQSVAVSSHCNKDIIPSEIQKDICQVDKNPKNCSYISPLEILHDPRKTQSGITGMINPNKVICPYELLGQCSDKDCKYNHIS